MNWDSRFASIVRETEQSLSRVKTQLQTPLSTRPSSSPNPNPHSRKLPYTPLSSSNNGILKPSKPGLESSWGRASNRGRRRSVSFDLGSPSQGEVVGREGGGTVMALLTARLRDQQKDIVSLQESVSSLQSSVNNLNRQLKTLQSDINKVQSKPPQQSITSLESQFQQFKREVTKEMDSLRTRLTNTRTGNNSAHSDNSIHSIAQELHASKRLLRNDIDSLQEDISSLKSKSRSQESEVSLWGTNIREMERKQDKLDKSLSRLHDWQRGEELDKTRQTTSVQDHNGQLQRLRQLTSDLQSRLSTLEQRSSFTQSTLQTKEPPRPGMNFDLSSSSSSPFSRSTLSKVSSQGSRPLRSSTFGSTSYHRPRHSIISPSGYGLSNPLYDRSLTSSLRGQSSHHVLSDDDDTMDNVSVLSLESGGLELDESLDMMNDGLSRDLELDDLSPSTSLLSVGAL